MLNTLQDIADSVNESLKSLGFPQHELEAYKQFVGDGRDVLAARALPPDNRDTATVKRLVELIDAEYSERWADKTTLYDGIPRLLDELTSRKLKLAVLSNKGHDFTEMMVSKMLSRWHFEMILGLSPGMKKKPDPEAALRISRQFGIEPSEFLYLGDTDVDMKTAVAADMFPVGALWGFRSYEELVENGARAVINRPEELLLLLR